MLSVFRCGHSEQSGNYFQGRTINNKFNYLLARSLAATIDNTDHREGLRWLFIDEIFCRQLCDTLHTELWTVWTVMVVMNVGAVFVFYD